MRKLAALTALVAAFALSASATASSSHSRTVKLQDDYFSAARLTIKRGTLVTWRWSGYDPHNVTDSKGRFKSPTQVSGTPFRYRFKKAGTYNLVCAIHPAVMRERIVVK